MLDKRKVAKCKIEEMCKSEFYTAIDEAKLTPRQREIIEMKFIRDWSYLQIAFKLSVDINVIKQDMQKAYDKIYRLFYKNML